MNIDQCLCDVTSRGKDGEQDNLTHYHLPKNDEVCPKSQTSVLNI